MRLRNLEERDAHLMLEWMHDDSVVHDLRTNFATKTIEDCLKFIDEAHDTTENLHLAIVNDDNEYMGTVSLKHIKNESAEFGITIRKKAMGGGYSLFGMRAIIEYGFNVLGINYIYWCVNPENIRAVKFYDKNNYKRCDIPVQTFGYTEEEKLNYIWYCVIK